MKYYISKRHIPKEEHLRNLHYYEVRHGFSTPDRPDTIEDHVGVNFFGTLVTSEPIVIPATQKVLPFTKFVKQYSPQPVLTIKDVATPESRFRFED